MISIDMGVGTNPISEQEAGNWQVTTLNNVGGAFYIVDVGTLATSFITRSGTITPQSLVPNPRITGLVTADYTFLINTQHNIPGSGVVEILFPTGVTL